MLESRAKTRRVPASPLQPVYKPTRLSPSAALQNTCPASAYPPVPLGSMPDQEWCVLHTHSPYVFECLVRLRALVPCFGDGSSQENACSWWDKARTVQSYEKMDVSTRH
jgi:hypothetical protein